MRTLFLLSVLALSAPAYAQTAAKPAAPAPATDAQPAVNTSAKVRSSGSNELGTTVITGEGEAPLGVLLTPWIDSSPEKDIDRPARLLQEDMRPIDRDVFERQVEYYDALSKAEKRRPATP